MLHLSEPFNPCGCKWIRSENQNRVLCKQVCISKFIKYPVAHFVYEFL